MCAIVFPFILGSLPVVGFPSTGEHVGFKSKFTEVDLFR